MQAEGVKGAQKRPWTARVHASRQPRDQARTHLRRGLVGEGERQQPRRVHPALLDQPCHPFNDDAGLAAARARKHQRRTLRRLHRGLLRFI